jgi:hypothetical protein
MYIMKSKSNTFVSTHFLILLNAAFWLGYAIITILTNHDAATVSYVARWIFAFLALGISALLVVLTFLLRKGCYVHFSTLSGTKPQCLPLEGKVVRSAG